MSPEPPNEVIQLHPKVVRRVIDKVTIPAAGSFLSSTVDLADVYMLAISMRCKYSDQASDPLTAYVYTSTDDINWDTEELVSFSSIVDAGEIVQKTVYIDPDAQEIRVKVTNEDAAESVTEVVVEATLTF